MSCSRVYACYFYYMYMYMYSTCTLLYYYHTQALQLRATSLLSTRISLAGFRM